jgi:hypothetical protein
MVRDLLGLGYEAFKLYLVLSFLAVAMAIPHAVVHWAFLGLVAVICAPAFVRRG